MRQRDLPPSAPYWPTSRSAVRWSKRTTGPQPARRPLRRRDLPPATTPRAKRAPDPKRPRPVRLRSARCRELVRSRRGLHRPVRCAEYRQQGARHLGERPRTRQLKPGHADDIAAPEFGKQPHQPAPWLAGGQAKGKASAGGRWTFSRSSMRTRDGNGLGSNSG
jgi:hypothetical protein